MRVQCLIGGEAVYINPDDPVQDIHVRLDAVCTHCCEHGNADPRHHCGRAGSACDGNHDGTCLGHGDTPEERLNRPGGCTVCRPVLIEPFATVTPA